MRKRKVKLHRYVFDLDGTLCSNESDVYTAIPFFNRIKKVNELYDQGHIIIIDTARGKLTGKDHLQQTEEQLKKWGLKYKILQTGEKAFGDYYIDDKAVNDKDFFKLK